MRYTVKQGDCLTSIADAHGMLPDTIWKASGNAQLRRDRGDPNVLAPGDVLEIPERERKEESCATEARHRFRRKAAAAKLRLRLLDESDQPRSGVSYTLVVDGESFSGTTDGDGKLEHPIPPRARAGELRIAEEAPIRLDLGHLDPVSKTSGVQARLRNLGYDCGPIDGKIGEKTREAIQAFQANSGLEPTGDLDDAVRSKLEEKHGS